MKKRVSTKKFLIAALCVAAGITFQIAESAFDFFAVPGGKIGLANIITVVSIYLLGWKYATVIAAMRALLGCLLYGGVGAVPYSFCGAVLSALCMAIVHKIAGSSISAVGISVLGAAVSSAAQVAVGAVIFSSFYLFTYLPVILLISLAGGICTGFGAKIILDRMVAKSL